MATGWVILDANCFKYLEDECLRRRVLGSLRAVDLTIWPTALDALELAKTENQAIRLRLLEVANRLLGARPLLPLPDEIFRKSGESLAAGRPSFPLEPSGFEWLLHSPNDISQSDIDLFASVLSSADMALDRAFTTARPDIQQFLKDHQLKEEWASIGQFLNLQWMKPSQLDDLIKAEWSRFGLPGAPDVNMILQSEAWRLHFEAFGAGLFQRVITHEQSKRIQAWDLWQLIYLAGQERRIIVTEDTAFFAAASGVLAGRHTNALALQWADFVTSAAASTACS